MITCIFRRHSASQLNFCRSCWFFIYWRLQPSDHLNFWIVTGNSRDFVLTILTAIKNSIVCTFAIGDLISRWTFQKCHSVYKKLVLQTKSRNQQLGMLLYTKIAISPTAICLCLCTQLHAQANIQNMKLATMKVWIRGGAFICVPGDYYCPTKNWDQQLGYTL